MGVGAAQASCTSSAIDPDVSCSLMGLVGGVTALNTAFAIDYLGSSSPFVVSTPGAKPGQEQYGLWIRAIGGSVSISSNFSGISNTGVANGPVSGRVSLPTSYAGFQAGLDTGAINLGNSGWQVHGGVTFGYARAFPSLPSDDGVGTTPDEYMNASLSPGFVGVYGAFFRDNFFANIQLRHVWQGININSSDYGLNNSVMPAHTWDLTSGIGYRIQMPSFFVEPSAGLDLSKTSFGNVYAPGFLGTGENFPGTLAVGDINTALGYVGGRVGTAFSAGNALIQPSAYANLWHEFAGPVSAQFISASVDNSSVSTSRVGTFGQIGAGLAAQFGQSGVTAYVKGSYLTGQSIQGYNLGAGVRYSF